MAGLLNFIRRKSNRELIFWLLDRLAAFFEHLAALTTDPVLKLYIPNAMVVCIYKDVSRDIEVWVGEVKNYIPRSEWSKIVSDLEGIADSHGYVFLDKNGELISVTRLSSDSVEFRFHAMSFGGVVRARRSDLAKSFTKYREYVDAEEKS
jgi:hypothetical protein